MKIVVIGGSGLIGSQLVDRLRKCGAELNDQSLVPGPGGRLGSLTFGDWLRQTISPD